MALNLRSNKTTQVEKYYSEEPLAKIQSDRLFVAHSWYMYMYIVCPILMTNDFIVCFNFLRETSTLQADLKEIKATRDSVQRETRLELLTLKQKFTKVEKVHC